MSERLTVGQAVVRFLEAQYVERDGVENAFFAGCWGIFGHGNVAGVGQALLERELSGEPRTCATSRDATNRPWCTQPWHTPASATGSRRWPSQPLWARVRPT